MEAKKKFWECLLLSCVAILLSILQPGKKTLVMSLGKMRQYLSCFMQASLTSARKAEGALQRLFVSYGHALFKKSTSANTSVNVPPRSIENLICGLFSPVASDEIIDGDI